MLVNLSWVPALVSLGLKHPLLLTLLVSPSRPPLHPQSLIPRQDSGPLLILIPFRLRRPQALCSFCSRRALFTYQLRVSSLLTLFHTHLSICFCFFFGLLPYHVRFYSSHSLHSADLILLKPLFKKRFYSWTTLHTVTMKNLITYTLAATLAAGATAQHHQHQHMHARRHAGSKIEKRSPDVVTEVVVGATETVYELAGKEIDINAAKAGLDGGSLVIVGESNPTYDAPAAPQTPAAQAVKVSEHKQEVGAQFYESKTEASTEASAEASADIPKPVYSAPAASKPAASKPKASKPKTGGSSSGFTGTGSGVDKKFESGTISCDTFPSEYGAVALDWLELGGWSGIQYVPDFTLSSKSIFKIATAIKGEGCTPGAMCSYACPAGYQKTQWPSAQGADKESVGGLYCNEDGKLELTRDGYDTLCDAGVGGVSIQNDLDEDVVTCRTDYPGTENMVIPALASAGSSVNICNPEQDKYYVWNGSGTSAQYYVNKKGYSIEDACVWDSPKGKDAGNWSPVVLGVGQAADGNTYISIFQNLPTSHAELDFNIEIKGDVNTKCSYVNGKWSAGGSGCTTTIPKGGKAVIRYF